MVLVRPALALLLLAATLPAAAVEVVVGSGRFEAAPVGVAAWKPKACALPATVTQIQAKTGPIKAGAVLATLSVAGMADAITEAKRNLAKAERDHKFLLEDAAALDQDLAAAALRAQADADAAAEKREHWQETGRADALLDSSQKLSQLEAGLRDAREELRQLEQMYKEARIDNSTQDLVVGRERRRLAQAEVDFDQNKRRHAHLEAVELPQADAALERADTEAQLRLDAEARRAAREKARMEDALAAASKADDAARRRLAELEADAAALAVTASADGYLGDFTLKVGDKINPGQEVARIGGESGGQVRFEVAPEVIGRLPVGAPVRLRWPETGAVAGGVVTEAAWAGRPEGSVTRFPVVAKTESPSRPGLKVEVVVDDGRKK